jgi:Carboxypeptidase regulatory-like domain
MQVRRGRMACQLILVSFLALGLLGSLAVAQNFRGGIVGSVTDPTGAALPGVQVTSVATSTNTTYRTVTSSAGEFSFSDLPLGDYTVSVSASGFAAENIKHVPVTAGVTYSLPIKV